MNWILSLFILLSTCSYIFSLDTRCGCPLDLEIRFANQNVAGIDQLHVDEENILDYLFIVKDGKCAFKWTPQFVDKHNIASFSFQKLMRDEPCFENNDVVDIFMRIDKCCQSTSIRIASQIKIDTLSNRYLDIAFGILESQNNAIDVQIQASAEPTPTCWSLIDENQFRNTLQASRLSLLSTDNDEANGHFVGWQYIFNEYCHFNIYRSSSVLDISDITQIFRNHECSSMQHFYVLPLLESENGKHSTICGSPLPYKFSVAADHSKGRSVTIKLVEPTESNSAQCSSENFIVDSSDSLPQTQEDCTNNPTTILERSLFQSGISCQCSPPPKPLRVHDHGVVTLNFEGIEQDWNLIFLARNKRDNSEIKLTPQGSKTFHIATDLPNIKPLDTFDLFLSATSCNCDTEYTILAEEILFSPSENSGLHVTFDSGAVDFNILEPRVELVGLQPTFVALYTEETDICSVTLPVIEEESAVSAIITFPVYFIGNIITFSILDITKPELAYVLWDYYEIQVTDESSSVLISNLLPGKKLQLDYSVSDPKTNPSVQICKNSVPFATQCGCGTNPQNDAPILDPTTAVTQNRGFVTFKFKDNSLCDEGYAFSRQRQARDGTLSTAEIFTPVYFNYKEQGCLSLYDPRLVAADELAVSNLIVGEFYRYSIQGTSEGYIGTASSVVHQIRWESSIAGYIGLSSEASAFPVSGVKVHWILKDSNRKPLYQGDVTTDGTGRFEINLNAIVSFDNNDKYPVDLTFEKTSILADGSKMKHVFLCDNERTNCTESGTTVYLRHLEFENQIRVSDATSVPVTGHIYVSNTDVNPDGKKWGKDGCPVVNVTVCLIDMTVGARNKQLVCVETDYLGAYTLPGPLGVRVFVNVSHGEHTFKYIATGKTFDEATGFVVELGGYYQNIDFEDTTVVDVDVAVAGGLCDIFLGDASLLFKIVGCDWGGAKKTQRGVHKLHQVPAYYTKIKVESIEDHPMVQFDSQFIHLENAETQEVRFQYDGEPTVRIEFPGRIDSGNCTNIDGDADVKVVLPFETPMYLVIYVTMDLGGNKICDNLDPNTTLFIQNELGLQADSTSDNAYKVALEKLYFPKVIDIFERCNKGCELPIVRDYDAVKQRYGLSRVEFVFATGRPNIVYPHTKYFHVTPNIFGANRYTAEVVVVGQFKEKDLYSLTLPTYEPILIIRDPPGGGSSSFYENIVTTLRRENKKIQAYVGYDVKNEASGGASLDVGDCKGLVFQLCSDLFQYEQGLRSTQAKSGLGKSQLNGNVNSAEFTTTWTYTTSTDQYLVGPASDVFVVPNLDAVYAQTKIVEWNAANCKATIKEEVTFYLQSPDNRPAIAFVTAYQVENVEIPSLENLRDATLEDFRKCKQDEPESCKQLNETIAATEDAINGWKGALKLNNDLKAQAALGGLDLVKPHQWFDKIVRPHMLDKLEDSGNLPFGETPFDTEGINVNSAFASSELLSNAKLRERYTTSNMDSIDIQTLNTIRFSGGGSTMTYKLTQNQMEQHSKMLGGGSENFDSSDSNSGTWSIDSTILVASLADSGSAGSKRDKSTSHTLDNSTTKETSIGFTLSDPNIGDVFDVDVYIDPRFGTFIFHTRSGKSMCPTEANTDPQIIPKLEILSRPPYTVLPDRPMIFELKISNTGTYPGSFVLTYENLNAVYGGITFYRILPLTFDRIEPGQSILTTFSVFRGPVEYEYDTMALKLQVGCESGQDLRLLGSGGVKQHLVNLYNQQKDEKQMMVWARTCPKVYLAGDIEKDQSFLVTIDKHSDLNLPIVIRNPTSSTMKLSKALESASTRLTDIQLQYRRVASSSEWNIGQYKEGNKYVDINFANEGLEDEYGMVSVDWALDKLPDGDYEFRVVSICEEIQGASEEFNLFSTEIIAGSIDRTYPKIFGLPTPAGKLAVDDDIVIEFDKQLDCSQPFRFRIKAEITSGDVFVDDNFRIVCEDRSISIMFDPANSKLNALEGYHMSLHLTDVYGLNENVAPDPIVYEVELQKAQGRRRLEEEAMSSTGGDSAIMDRIEIEKILAAIKMPEMSESDSDTIDKIKTEFAELGNSQQRLLQGLSITIVGVVFVSILLLFCGSSSRDAHRYRGSSSTPYYLPSSIGDLSDHRKLKAMVQPVD